MQSIERPLAVDLFCGAGGLSLGFEQAGFHVVAAVDFNPVNTATYSQNFPATKTICADISGLTGSQIRNSCGLKAERIDVVFGGPPCQGFSTIGKRNMADPRNELIFQFARIVAELKPRYFVLENVAGLLHTPSRAVIERALDQLRSEDFQCVLPLQVLDAQGFGVPQRRRRVFVLGFLAGEEPPAYPVPRHAEVTVWDAIGDLRGIRGDRLFSEDEFIGRLGPPSRYSTKLRLRDERVQLSGCLLSRHSPNVTQRFRRTRPGGQEDVSRFARLRKSSVAPTLRAGTPPSHGSFTAPRPIHPTQPRCITVREAARLHSFPDWFQFHGTRWHGFQQIGNSVPPMLAKAVAKAVKRASGSKKR
jgi:DNA (cytosine-5)-methyltransferase 1